jgi:hypothetical protein
MQQNKARNKKINWVQLLPVILFCLFGAVLIRLVSNKQFVFGSIIGTWYYQYFKVETSILKIGRAHV